MPETAGEGGPILDRVRALTTWLASSWEHANSAVAMQFAPWDAETVLDWGAAQRGHNGQRPIVHCVHFSSTFVSCCQAVGIPARGAVFTNQQPDGWFGHFTAEFWSDEHEKWVMVDPQIDALFVDNGEPMSVNEVQAARSELSKYTEFGPGTNEQRKNPRLYDFIDVGYPVGRSFKHRSVWYRSDLLTHPEYSPPPTGRCPTVKRASYGRTVKRTSLVCSRTTATQTISTALRAQEPRRAHCMRPSSLDWRPYEV